MGYNDCMEVLRREQEEITRLKTGINKILDKFQLLGEYTIEDYKTAMQELAELVEI
ncbi:MAG: hypothetical protein GPJ51_08370 [Candidatus Heimdallarchaeota archaeon]|nr:hypothetical protein [Candidatus Heimdallarchaeota archaeon]